MKWIVQRMNRREGRKVFDYSWDDIPGPHTGIITPLADQSWEAGVAAEAFKLAVIDNPAEQIQETTYRVLPFSGGVSFNVGLNVDAVVHDVEAAV